LKTSLSDAIRVDAQKYRRLRANKCDAADCNRGDGKIVYDVVAERRPKATVIVPHRITAVANETTAARGDRSSVRARATAAA
jgi:hypothetical protein